MKRFIKAYSQEDFCGENEIWVDAMTGVNYLWHRSLEGGGFTPFLDENGKPIVTKNVNK